MCEKTEAKWERLVRIASFTEEPEKTEAENSWHPIETAPKTGEFIVIVADGEPPLVVQWRDNYSEWWTPEYLDSAFAVHNMTHWTPLPKGFEVTKGWKKNY